MNSKKIGPITVFEKIFRAHLHRMFEGLLRIHHAPARRGGAEAVLFDEAGGECVRFGVQNVRNVALLPELDARLALVTADQHVPHPGEKVAQFLRLGMGEFDEL